MPKCDPRAFARCPYNKTCAPVGTAEFTEGSDCDAYNRKVLQTPITEADKIRGMSDMELATFLYTLSRSCADHQCGECPIGPDNCIVMLPWLKRNAKEGDECGGRTTV